MGDEVPLVPATGAVRGVHPGYVALLVVLALAVGGGGAWLALRAAAPGGGDGLRPTQATEAEPKRPARGEVEKARAEAAVAVKQHALLRSQLREAEARAASAETSAKRLEDLQRENAEVNKGLLAQLDEAKGYGKKLKDVADELAKGQKPVVPPPPAAVVLRAGGQAVVRKVIGPGVMTQTEGGRDAAEKQNRFEAGETVAVREVTAIGVRIETPTATRGGWLTVKEASEYLQPIQEK